MAVASAMSLSVTPLASWVDNVTSNGFADAEPFGAVIFFQQSAPPPGSPATDLHSFFSGVTLGLFANGNRVKARTR
jgi:hypothetical protein